LPGSRHLAQERRPPLAVQLGKHVIQQENGPLAGAPGDQGRFRQLQADHRRPLLALRSIRSSFAPVEQDT